MDPPEMNEIAYLRPVYKWSFKHTEHTVGMIAVNLFGCTPQAENAAHYT